MKRMKSLVPESTGLPVWESYAEDLMTEYRQCLDEGLEIAPYRALFEAVSGMPAGEIRSRLADTMSDLVLNLPQDPAYPYAEPSDLEGIRSSCAFDGNRYVLPETDLLRDKIAGAWYGRICGCLLGKTVEGIRTPELHRLLKESGNWPMHRYIRRDDVTREMLDTFRFPLGDRCYADRLECAPADDDTNYVVLAQVLVERYGREFTPAQVAEVWMSCQPKVAYCTAERVAFRNFVMGYRPPDSAVYQNPFREWIGAQIRGDYFGYINPGNPAKAAEMAWRDASVSHVKNGIYGEMFIAALIALAAVKRNLTEMIREALNYVPAASRLHESVLKVLDGYEHGVTREACMAAIHTAWDENSAHDWCHTVSNAMIVTAALLYGGGDYGKSVCMAVQEGFDTDCNGATVGSVLGMRNGKEALPEVWTAPVRGRLKTQILGIDELKIDEAVEKTLSHMDTDRPE